MRRAFPVLVLSAWLLAACGGGGGGSNAGSSGGGATGSSGGNAAAPGPVSPLDAAAVSLDVQSPDQVAAAPTVATEADPLNPANGAMPGASDTADALPLSRAQLPAVAADPEKPNA